MLTGRPHKTEDFLDFSRRTRPIQVEVGLASEEFPTDVTVLVELIATFMWRFPGFTATSREVCTAYSLQNGRELKRKRIAQANGTLQRCLERIEANRITVVGREQKFAEV